VVKQKNVMILQKILENQKLLEKIGIENNMVSRRSNDEMLVHRRVHKSLNIYKIIID